MVLRIRMTRKMMMMRRGKRRWWRRKMRTTRRMRRPRRRGSWWRARGTCGSRGCRAPPGRLARMLVVVQGDPLALSTSLTGLDILAARHPKLHALLLDRLDFTLGPGGQVGVKEGRSGDCAADVEGRQVTLRPALYPTDVLNILTETGGFTVTAMA